MSNTADIRTEFENVSDGVVGAVVLDEHGRSKGIPVKPGEFVWLSEREEILTANAPKRDADNPFTNGSLSVKTRSTEVLNRRPIGSRDVVGDAVTPVASPEPEEPMLDEGNEPQPPPREERPAIEEVGAPPLPEGDPAHGVRAPGEEVGTPEVVASGKRPAPGRGKTVRSDNPAAKPAPKEGAAQAVIVGQGGPQLVETEGR